MAVPPHNNPILAAAKPVLDKLFAEYAVRFVAATERVAKGVRDNAIVALQIGFSEYLSVTYNRCKYFKSILDPQKPIELMSHYLSVNLSCGDISCSDDQLIESLDKYKKIVVTGLAGSGKSMLMKYVSVCGFERPSGKIPLFIELRSLNALTERDFLAFIRTSCRGKSHEVTEDQFSLSLRSGSLMLILDGFDEVKSEFRDEIQSQILALGKDFPQATIIVSSRPDSRFGSWQSFFVFEVDELTEEKVIQLIEGLEYDSGVKTRFLKEVKSRLYRSHRSFLSYPLLASISY